MRHPPPTARYMRVTSSTQLIHNDDKALKRNADQIRLQTSGEIGRFYVDARTKSDRLNRSGNMVSEEYGRPSTSNPLSSNSRHLNHDYSHQKVSSDARNSSVILGDSPRLITSSRCNRPSTVGGNLTSSSLMGTLKTLDRTFGNNNRRDIVAASKPERADVELVWTVTSNHRAAMQSNPWADKLR